MQSRLITTENELVALKNAWDRLVEGNPETDVPFYSWDWFYRLWLHFGKPENRRLAVLVVEDDERLLGLLPLVSGPRTSGRISYRILEFCAVGMMPRNTAYVVPEYAETVFSTIAEALYSRSGLWDMLELSNIPETSPFHAFWTEDRRELRHGLIRCRGFDAPFVRIEGTLDEYYKDLSKGARKNILKHLKLFNETERAQTVRFFETPEEIDEGLDRMLDVRKNSWKGGFQNPHYPEFYREITPLLAERNQVSIGILGLDQTPIAAGYMLSRSGVFFGHTRDYDARFREWAPGILLLHFQLKRLLEEGGRTFDFCGTTYDHKEKFATGSGRHSTFQIFHPGLKSRFLFYAKTVLLPLLRKMLRKPEPDDLVSHRNRF